MNKFNKQRHKGILLRTFKDFDLLCKEYSLTYYMAYGTLIGAIRHKGLIPWDDDIDVYMPIEDYCRFLSLKNKLTIPYRICDIEDDGYFKPFAKFCDSNTTIWEDRDIPFVFGVFIDIFPLYEGTELDFQELKPKFHEYSWKYEMGVRKVTWSNIVYTFRHQGLKAGFGKIKYKILFGWCKKVYLEKFKAVEKECRQRRGNYYISYCGPYEKECFPKEWFTSVIELQYESQVCLAPSGYDAYLKHLYGDYMTPPPVEKQASGGHPKVYVNLDEHLTIEDIKDELRK